MSQSDKCLEKKGVRPTSMRLLVFQHLSISKAARTLTDIENALERADRTTIFRTLKTFEQKGIVHQIDDGSGITKYALCEEGCNCELEQDLHLHFHCNNCTETVCLTEYKIPYINLPHGYVAESANLVLKGFCNKCSGQ
ncbi:MAG: Fur family transcriptional regulator [Allomuricauda sp.]